MASTSTGIEWTDATWNPVTGCTQVSPGCAEPASDEFEDWVVIERLAAGEHPGPRYPTRAERAAAARQLQNRGYTRGAIATRLHLSGATLTRLLLPATTTETTEAA